MKSSKVPSMRFASNIKAGDKIKLTGSDEVHVVASASRKSGLVTLEMKSGSQYYLSQRAVVRLTD